MLPYLERLQIAPDASWSMLNRRLDEAIPFQWHHHPEYELTLTLNSTGQRFIGNHVGEYGHGDLVLVGPNLPHTWVSRDKVRSGEPHVALVFWFSRDWIEGIAASAVEFEPLRQLAERAKTGLAFDPTLGAVLAADFEAIFELAPADRLLGLLDILLRLAGCSEGAPLSSSIPVETDGERTRIDRVLQHLHLHYAEPVPLEELADIAALSVSGLHRMFTKHTRSSISDYLTGLRIGDACARLAGGNEPIGHIAAEVGYPSLANFNRQFRRLRSMTPREYRNSFRR